MPLLAVLARRRCRGWIALALPVVAVLSTACLVAVTSTRVDPIEPGLAVTVRTAVKAHLRDGSTVVYRTGVLVRGDSLVGAGVRYNLTLTDSLRVALVSVADVVGMESFNRQTDAGASVMLSLFGTAGLTFGLGLLALAIFGSCPTFYSDSAGHSRLEAEGFSYSIAPLFEARDVDRLRALPDSAGIVRLEVRNEAAETHYLNHLELLDVARDPDELVLPEAAGGVIAVGHRRAPLRVIDGAGRDVRQALAAADGRLFASDARLLARAGPGRHHDTLFITLPPVAGDSAALLLRLRNSLLTTVLLYDVMIRRQGALALDWMGAELADLGSAIELGRWYRRDLGLHVEVEGDSGWREIAWVRDVGPIAFEDIGVVLPVTPGAATRVRLVFPIDAWRIDWLEVGASIRRPVTRRVPLLATYGREGAAVAPAKDLLGEPDDTYLETRPGQYFTAAFDVGPAPSDRRTLLLVTQGYYTEWLRPSWLEPEANPPRFVADSTSLGLALSRWRVVRDSLEQQFEATKIPVR